MQWKIMATVLVFGTYILGCSIPPSTSQITSTKVSTQALVAPVTEPSLDMVSPEIYPPSTTIKPLAQAQQIRFDNWSPDSRWIAFWQGESEDLPAHLAFIDAQSHEICQHNDLTSDFWNGRTIWQDANSVSVIVNQGQNQIIFSGFPCNKFEPITDGIVPEPTSEVSPDGRFRADIERRSEEQILHNSVSIIDIATGEKIIETSWDASVHSLRSGPGWLNNEQYLIGQTLDQGLLYISVPEKNIGDVFSDLFKIDTTFGENTWHVFSHTEPAASTYHILFQWDGGPERLPLLLYHSELNQIEELPFYDVSPFEATGYAPLDFFSPDGKWLLVNEPTNTEAPPDNTNASLWLLAIDPPREEAVKIAEGLAPGTTSWESQKIAFFDRESIYVRSIPNGDFLSHWVAENWSLTPMDWSPNGKWLVAVGLPKNGSDEAIFLIEP